MSLNPSFSRRAVLGAAAAVPLAVAATGTAQASGTSQASATSPASGKRRGHRSSAVPFTLNAYVLNGGEQVVSVTLHTSRLGAIDPRSVTADTFTVHAQAVSPVPLLEGELIFSEYDLDREITGVSIDRKGNLTIKLLSEEGGTGGGTLGYLSSRGRNVELELTYTITQNRPLRLRSGKPVTITEFVQGDLVDPEVDAYSYGTSAGTGMKYRLFTPRRRGRGHRAKRPLVVWLHGGGEGGMGDRQTNEAQLRANRGALGFSTDEAQRIFGGAYVVAPQCESAWMNDGPRFAPLIKTLIDELIAKHSDIDPARVHVLGCSNGGYMTLKMELDYPDFFASGVPICPGASDRFFTEDELRVVSSTPTWFVHSLADTTLPFDENTGRAAPLVKGSIVSAYPTVTVDGYTFPGHWSWIYVALNDPEHDGQHIWQWMAQQRR